MYSTDLAYIHDAGFSDFAERASPEVVKILRARLIAGGKIVEAGCGGGTLARHLADAGYDVLGFDISPAMIRLARAKAPGASFRVASLATAQIPRCRAVVAIGEVVTYVPAGGAGRDRAAPLRDFFSRVHAALRPGGVLIFDFIESGARRTYRATARSGGDWVVAAEAQLDRSGRSLTRRIVTIRKTGRGYRHSREVHRVRIYTRRAVARALADAGFTTSMSRSYGRCRLLPGGVAVLADKR